MAAQTIYMMNGRGPDPAILRGLVEAGCTVVDTHNVTDTLANLHSMQSQANHAHVLLVAEVQAGAIPLLTLLRETGMHLPPTLLFDQEGNNLQDAIKALQMGVQEYVLASDPDAQRELRARILAERNAVKPGQARKAAYTPARPAPTPSAALAGEFRWDAESHVIYIEDKHVRLSPVEGRVFDLLVSRRNHTVSLDELIAHALRRSDGNVDEGVKLLRPHMMRLRNKLEQHPRLAHRVVNVRGSGYMFI